MGRPPKKEHERRTVLFRIRLTAQEKRALDRLAKGSHDSTSAWARRVLLSQGDKP